MMVARACVLLVALATAPAAAAPSPVIVRASCPAPSYQTGFLLAGVNGIVTALHGVAGCTNITAEVGSAGGIIDVHLAAYNLRADLAVLQRTGGGAIASDVYSRGAPTLQAQVVGFPHSVPSPLRTRLQLRGLAPVPLKSLVPRQDINILATRESPSPGTLVYSVEGHITVGHSGGPLLNGQGEVFAIANGGLSKGSTEVTWAVPISELGQLTPGDLPADRKRLLRETSLLLFSERSSSLSGLPSTVKCANRTFTLVRGSWLDDLIDEVDDSETYRYLAYVSGLLGKPHEFAVYRNLDTTGADARTPVTLLVPAGWTFTDAARCTTRSAHGISIEFELQSIATPSTITARYGSFEYTSFCSASYYVDPRFSNWMGRSTLDSGIVTQRKSYYQAEVRCALPNTPVAAWSTPSVWLAPLGPAPAGPYQCGLPMCPATPRGQTVPYPQAWGTYAPISNLLKGVGFFSAVASRDLMLFASLKYTNAAVLQKLEQCAMNLDLSAPCQQARDTGRDWGLGVLAATASTLTP